MKVPFLDLRVPADERVKLLEAVDRVLEHGRFVLGPEVEELEGRVATRYGRKYAVGVNSGTSALYLALRALGVGPGDEVITTSLSWIATANAIALTGAMPVFADIRDDLNIDPRSVGKLFSRRTIAILPVHFTGYPCSIMELRKQADAHGTWLVEDACQSFGMGGMVGGAGHIVCFSMNAMKVFASCGEAGMVLTGEEDFADRIRSLRYNGTIEKEYCVEPSFNARLDTLQAAILLARLPYVADILCLRKERAEWYDTLLKGIVKTPPVGGTYYTYTIRCERREELAIFLAERGVETKIQHPILMPEQPAYKGCRGEWTNAKRLIGEILCLPANEKTTREQVEYVAQCIKDFYGG